MRQFRGPADRTTTTGGFPPLAAGREWYAAWKTSGFRIHQQALRRIERLLRSRPRAVDDLYLCGVRDHWDDIDTGSGNQTRVGVRQARVAARPASCLLYTSPSPRDGL